MKRALTLMAVLLMLVPATYAQMIGGGQHGSMMNQNAKEDTVMVNQGMMNSGMMGGGMMSGMMKGGMMSSGMMNSGTMMNPLASLMDLGLSDDQIDQLVDIQANRIKKSLEIQRTMLVAREELSELKRAEDPNFDRIQDQMVRVAKAEAELMKLNANVEKRAMQVLTDDQKLALGENSLPMPMHSEMSCPMMSGGGMMNMMQSGMMGESSSTGSGMMSGQGSSGSMSGTDHDSHH